MCSRGGRLRHKNEGVQSWIHIHIFTFATLLHNRRINTKPIPPLIQVHITRTLPAKRESRERKTLLRSTHPHLLWRRCIRLRCEPTPTTRAGRREVQGPAHTLTRQCQTDHHRQAMAAPIRERCTVSIRTPVAAWLGETCFDLVCLTLATVALSMKR